MLSIVNNNREVLRDPVGSRIWSGWIIQGLNSSTFLPHPYTLPLLTTPFIPDAIAMGALVKELYVFGKPYWIIPFCIFIGLFTPLPFYFLAKYSPQGSWFRRTMEYIHVPVLALYIGYLPFSVNGQWWSCVVIGFASQWWARTRRPAWFKKVG